MNMTELREAFTDWPFAAPCEEAIEILQLLRDPTPITEAGLRGLGFERWTLRSWKCGPLIIEERTLEGNWLAEICREYVTVKTIGKLRCLLLGVGE